MSNRGIPYLSKRLFLLGLNCPKALYLEKYHKELKEDPSDELEALFQSGFEVDEMARQLFPGGVEIPYEDLSFDEQLDLTSGEMKRRTPVIYQAAFSFENTFVKTDILKKKGKKWDLYEVKGSTSVNDELHINDLGVQYYVIKGSGIQIDRAYIVHVNNEYVRQGGIEVEKLFRIVDCTETVLERQGSIKEELTAMRKMLSGSMPETDIGEQCDDDCAFYGYCWQHVPENSIFSIESKWIDKFAYYNRGIVRLEDLPEQELDDLQKMYVSAYLHHAEFTNRESIGDFLSSLRYPLYFLDFETVYLVPVPMFEGTMPYQQIPFQYSLHWLKNTDSPLEHSEYLGRPGTDPRRELIEKLLLEIPSDACVLVYDQTFEKRILHSLAEWFPEHGDKIRRIIDNIRDLMVPFRDKDYYHRDLWGSYSLKYVLPALVPEMGYDEMAIQNGGMAADAYMRMYYSTDPQEIERIRRALLEYCKLDTLAEVKVLERLQSLLKQ